MISFCWLMQFEPIFKDPDGKTKLRKYVDPAMNDDYPIDAVWKVGAFLIALTDLQ